jgi:hypothetical protein
LRQALFSLRSPGQFCIPSQTALASNKSKTSLLF